MKLIDPISHTVTEGDFTDPRGKITALHIEDPNCRGWFLELSLSPAGLRLWARRHDGAAAAMPCEQLLKLFREHAPEIFADESAIAEARRVVEARQPKKAEPIPLREGPAAPTRGEREAAAAEHGGARFRRAET